MNLSESEEKFLLKLEKSLRVKKSSYSLYRSWHGIMCCDRKLGIRNSAAPHQRDASHVQVPAVLLGRGAQQHVTLRIADDLGAEQRPPHVLDELLPVAHIRLRLRPAQNFLRFQPLVFERRQAARKHALADQCHRLPLVERADHRPLARALLSRRIQNLVHQRRPVVVLLGEDVARDLDQVAIQLALVPLREHLVQLVGRQAEPAMQQIVGLANQLHVAVLDPVVHHLHEVPGPVLAHPVAARRAVLHLGGDRLEDRLHVRPRRRIPARHDGRPSPRALFAARNAGADEQDSLLLQRLGPPRRIREQRVAAVDDDVARFQVRRHGFDHLVHGAARLHHQ